MLCGAGVACGADGARRAMAGMIWVISGRYPTRGYPGSGGQGLFKINFGRTALRPAAESLSGSDRGNLADPTGAPSPGPPGVTRRSGMSLGDAATAGKWAHHKPGTLAEAVARGESTAGHRQSPAIMPRGSLAGHLFTDQSHQSSAAHELQSG